MTAAGGGPSHGALRLLWETLIGRMPVERSGPWLRAFASLPAPVRDAVRWALRPRRRFLLGRLRALSGDRVMSGNFRGMRLMGLPVAPELLGTYERELSDVVRELVQRSFGRVVNVGARDGYYAVGLALLLPHAQVWAFEWDDEARGTLAETARANRVADRVQVRGYCDAPALAVALAEGTGVLLVCDIDGGEVPLLDPALVPALTRATILVECHGPPKPPSEPLLVMRFLPTHDVRRVALEARLLAQLPSGVAEPWRSRMPATMEALLQEHRIVEQSWLLLTPRG